MSTFQSLDWWNIILCALASAMQMRTRKQTPGNPTFVKCFETSLASRVYCLLLHVVASPPLSYFEDNFSWIVPYLAVVELLE